MTGDFDEEYLEELMKMDRQQREQSINKGIVTTVANEEHHNELIAQAKAEIAEAQKKEVARHRKTYLTSEIPVRPCTEDCPNRARCRDYQNGRVSDNDLCKPELRQIKKWQVAFRRGNMEALKDDAGAVAGSLAVQINRLMERVIEEGVVVETTKEGKFGTYKEKMAHPALQQVVNILKTLGIDLNSFLMTPKAQKDAPPQVQVNIGISADEINARFAARYSNKLPKGDTE